MTALSKFSLEDRIAIVTGGGQGIGKGIALKFADCGANVVIADINAKTAEAVAEEASRSGRRCLACVVDVTDSKQVTKLIETAIKEFGRIDILVNNVGGPVPLVPLVALSEEDWDHTIKLNLKSAFLCSKAAARIMIGQGKGNIINISSAAGHRGTSPGQASYSVAKGGVINLTYNLAIELAKYHIRVNAIAPGPIETPLGTSRQGSSEERVRKHQILLGRIGTTEDVAHAAVYLASDASDYVTGIVIDVKGGPDMRTGDYSTFLSRFPNL